MFFTLPKHIFLPKPPTPENGLLVEDVQLIPSVEYIVHTLPEEFVPTPTNPSTKSPVLFFTLPNVTDKRAPPSNGLLFEGVQFIPSIEDAIHTV